MDAVTAAEANRTFSAVLRRVREGQSVVVTSHGRPVARIIPFRTDDRVGATARTSLFDRLRSTPVLNTGRWSRADLYDRERRD